MNSPDANGYTALHSQANVIETLLTHGGKPNARTKAGLTVLDMTAKNEGQYEPDTAAPPIQAGAKRRPVLPEMMRPWPS
ncbi:MAG: hypothetical protein H7338_24000 [Candidatus Sericytochromatia bacterium]|nr:hypothetical protein [Candidatus Sericytochromatia bacterium]